MQQVTHFIGIGGIGMSALARILMKRGESVTGSDLSQSSLIRQLKEEGAQIYSGHHPEHISGARRVVFSSGIAKDNPEFCAAREQGIPLLHRSEMLAQLMEGSAPLLITGTHGKTTTSSLLAHLLIQADLDPSYAVGGVVQGLKTNGAHGRGIYFVAEADESDGSFLNYPSFGAILTNLENDHMDYWKEDEALENGFRQFASQVGSPDHLFWCRDDLRLSSLGLEGHSYGFSEEADLKIDNFQQLGWKIHFDLAFQGRVYRDIELPLIGAHNVLNASAVFGMGIKLDLPEETIRRGLASFQGVGRRMEKKGQIGQIDIYDDYAHHPTEIFATLRALKTATHCRRLVVAFQPHRFSRTRDCLEEFSGSFEYADAVIVTDIYAAQEDPIPGVSGELVLQRIKKSKTGPVEFVKREALPQFLSAFLQPGDLLLTMGAGDITQVGPAVLSALKQDE